jgi:RNA polymerase sigma factor (sigma-70 family)
MAVTERRHRAEPAIDDLYRQHAGEVYRYAYAVLGNHADAEDVTQTTFLNAYRALEQGVRPRKPSSWLLTISSNEMKERFRRDRARPRVVELDDRLPRLEPDEDSPSIGELLTALAKIPPQQRQAIVLREFEGRSYAETARILGVTTSALESLLFRARRSLSEKLKHQLTCTDAQLAVSKAVDRQLGRKERRRLRDHLAECPDCAQFARLQQRNQSALRGLLLIPIPLSLTLFKGLEGAGTASAATLPVTAGAGSVAVGTTAVVAGTGAGVGTVTASGGGLLAGGVAVKAVAAVAAVSLAGGVAVTGATELENHPATKTPAAVKPGKRLGQVAPRGGSVPGNGVARGTLTAPRQLKRAAKKARTATHTKRAAADALLKPTNAKKAQGLSAITRVNRARARQSSSPSAQTSQRIHRAKDSKITSGKAWGNAHSSEP